MFAVHGNGTVAKGSVNLADVGDTQVLEFRVVHVRRYGRERDQTETVSINCKVWGKRATALHEAVEKTTIGTDGKAHGRKVAIRGELCQRPSKEEGGRPFEYVNIDDLEFLDYVGGGKPAKETKAAEKAAEVAE